MGMWLIFHMFWDDQSQAALLFLEQQNLSLCSETCTPHVLRWHSRKSSLQSLKVCFPSRIFDDGHCVLNCPSGKFEFKNQCHPCHYTCRECQGNAPSNCISCGVGEGVWLLAHSSFLQNFSPTGHYLVWLRSLISGDQGMRLDSCSLESVHNLAVSACCQDRRSHYCSHRLLPWQRWERS